MSLVILKNIASMLIMVLCGIALVKTKLLDPDTAKKIAIISVYVIMPCNIVTAFQIDRTPEILGNLIFATVVSAFIQALLIGLSFLLKKPLRLTPVEQLSSSFSNSGIISLCLVRSIMGDAFSVYVFPYMVLQIILTWTYSMFLVGGREKMSVKALISMPTIWAIVAGLLLFFTGIRLPAFLYDTMTEIKACTGPIGMISIGLIIGGADMKAYFKNVRVFLICFLKLIAFPAVVMLILRLLPLERVMADPWNILMPTLICLAAPTANTVTTVAQLCDRDVEWASIINITSVILCVVTLPVMIAFFSLLT